MAGLGETDVVLRTKDLLPWRFYAGYENSGNTATGEDRLLSGFNWGNALGRDQQLNYQFMASPDFDQLRAHSASYIIPLSWRHTLTFFGSYATSTPDLVGDLFHLKGSSWQVSARYQVPLQDFSRLGWTQKISVGIDFKRSNNNLQFGGYQVFDRRTDTAQMTAGYTLIANDRFGTTSAEVEIMVSPGGLTNHNHTGDFAVARSAARAKYAIGRVVLERTAPLPGGFIGSARFSTQFANQNLLSSEQLGLGGYDTLRGYDEREAIGDNGFTFGGELQAPAFSLIKWLSRKRGTDHLKLLAFWSHGEAGNHELLPNEDAHLVLESAGVGFRYAIATYLTVRFDYGWQLRESRVADGRHGRRAHIGVIIAY